MSRVAFVSLAAAGLLMSASPARAHCDTMTGPVVTAAIVALDTHDLRPLLMWVRPSAEPELKAAFERTLRVRSQGADAHELATRYFLETVVRLHRAGEGAPYSGLKTEADDPAGLIAEADRALKERSADGLLERSARIVTDRLRERYARVVEASAHADESVDAGRAFVAAYVEYVHFVEALQTMGVDDHAVEGSHVAR